MPIFKAVILSGSPCTSLLIYVMLKLDDQKSGFGSNGVTVTKFLQLLMILELYLELSYFFSWISIVVTVTEVTKVPKFLTQK